MPSSSFSTYLQQMKGHSNTTRLIILGNQGADLDSIASALVLAWHLSDDQPEKAPVALITLPRYKLRLRPEVIFAFTQAGISPNDLLFRDDVNLENLLQQSAELVLVDHNNVDPTLDSSKHPVTAIIDHHHDEGLFPDAFPRIIEEVGSTATLIAELIFTKKGTMETSPALLLLGAILLDTANLSDKAGRSTARDQQIVDKLLLSSGVERGAFFNKLQRSRHDLAGLSTTELLDWDYKEWASPAGRYGISTVLLSLERWQERESGLSTSVAQFALGNMLSILIVMLVSNEDDFKRELIVFCRDWKVYSGFAEYLGRHNLKLTAVQDGVAAAERGGVVGMYRQGNVAISRKKLQPLVHLYLSDAFVAFRTRT